MYFPCFTSFHSQLDIDFPLLTPNLSGLAAPIVERPIRVFRWFCAVCPGADGMNGALGTRA
jgi:hypothetical protein